MIIRYWPSQAAKIPYACYQGMGRAGNLDIDTPALPHAPTVDINRLGTGGRDRGAAWDSLMPPYPFPMPKTKGFFKVFGYTHTR